MSDSNIITAEIREDVGKGASRRLRRSGKVPAVIYGGQRDPVSLTVQQRELLHAAEEESFYASVLEIRVGDDLVMGLEGGLIQIVIIANDVTIWIPATGFKQHFTCGIGHLEVNPNSPGGES